MTQTPHETPRRSAAADSPAGRTVSVIIPHYHDLAGLRRCLDALDRQTYPRDLFEIIVADNNSPEGLEAVATVVAGRAKLLLVTDKGAGPARNGAVAVATNEILAFIDSDCVAEPEWIEQGLAALPQYDFIGGRVKVLVGDPKRVTPSEAFERVFAFDFKNYITKQGFTGAGNFFCGREMFAKVGGFRQIVVEDIDWSHRARDLGYQLGYAPKAIVGHPGRATWADLLWKWRRINAERYALARERPGGRLLWFLQALAMPVSAIVHTPRVLFSPELDTVGQRFNALVVLYKLRFLRLFDGLAILLADARR